MSVLSVRDLSVELNTGRGPVTVVDRIDFDLERGKTLAIVGESGCGKTMTALAVMQLLPDSIARISSGSVVLESQDLFDLNEAQMRHVRGRRIGMIFQEPMTSLNPTFKVGWQIGETIRAHRRTTASARREEALGLLADVEIRDPESVIDKYPHELSGGMRQRVMIAMALANRPALLIADEPTTALDVTIQAQILRLITRLQREREMAVVLITHDLAIVNEVADDVAVMYLGRFVERGSVDAVLAKPCHPYTQALFASRVSRSHRGTKLPVVSGLIPSIYDRPSGCPFHPRCPLKTERCVQVVPAETATDKQFFRCHHPSPIGPQSQVPLPRGSSAHHATALYAQEIRHVFRKRTGLFGRHETVAVDDVSFSLEAGRTTAIVGESGSGKTTLGMILLGLRKPTSGQVFVENKPILEFRGLNALELRRKIQIVFQDPYGSLQPRMPIGEAMTEILEVHGIGSSRSERNTLAAAGLDQVGLGSDTVSRYPHEFSGGQRQRIAIARSLLLEPKILILDEPTSALDMSVQSQILNLLVELQARLGLTYLLITHNLDVVAYMADHVLVMDRGRIYEERDTEEILDCPETEPTKKLLGALLSADPADRRLFKSG